MAKVSLRIYDREIEGLIEHGQLDEAIAHCQRILKTFPKHLETYRLLGKAYLEAKRYTAAIDLFQRILMAVPDDFVSHVGMSIIRDDENKLDEAIWHMERAFEVQPSNAAIQGELQRLFGRRDGIEPPKIRMTRGALAHMYMQGELYSQAISEINAVLKQDPQRTDMQVLLATAYFRAGQKPDASELCGQLLKRSPYCFDANRIMVEVLPGTQRSESVQEHRQRVNELDPYAAFVQDSVFRSGEVSDAAVNLDRLEYLGQSVEAGADWSSSLGIGLGTGAAGALASSVSESEPEWLKSGGAAEPSMPAPAPIAEEQAEESIPDFLRQAGWGESTGAFQENAISLDEPEPADASAISQADLPDWIKAMQPGEAENQIPLRTAPAAPAAPEGPSDSGWLRSLGGDQPLETKPAEEESTPVSDAPDWLKSLGGDQPLETKPAEEGSAPVSDAPDWLRGLGEQAATMEPLATGRESDEEPPDWLNPKSPAPVQLAAKLPEFTPADFDAPPPTDTPPGPDPAAYLGNLGTSAQEQDDAMAWLEGLASKHGAKAEELVTDPNARSEIAPEWVDKARAIGEQAPELAPVDTPPGPDPAAYLGSLGTSAQEQDDAMAWLEGLASKHGAKPEELVTDPNARTDSAPEWVDKARAIGEPPAAPVSVKPVAESPQDETGLWLKGLREQEAEPNVSDWLNTLDEPAQPEAPAETRKTASLAEPGEAPAPASMPDWLSGLDSTPESESPAAPAAPDWLSGLQQDEKEVPQAVPGNQASPESMPASDLPDWLSGLDKKAPVGTTSNDLPGWLADEAQADQSLAEPTKPTDWKPIEDKESPAVPESWAQETDLHPEPAQPELQQPVSMPPVEQRLAMEIEKPAPPAARPRIVESVLPSKEVGLAQPRAEMGRGNIAAALEEYGRMIRKGKFLEEIIYDLREAIYRYPVEVSVWQALGDAYMRANRLQEALDAYTKAEELLR